MRDLTAVDFDWNDDAAAGFEAASVVDRGSSFEGIFRSQKDLRVEGELKGTIACDGTLFVAEGATVSATIDAEHVTVAGDVLGEVRCRGRLQILPSGRVRARVATGSLVIQEGAIYEGELDMAGVERAVPRPLRARSAPPPVSIEAAVADRQSSAGSTFIRRLGSPETAWESKEGDSGREDDSPEAPAT
ncbi:MAG: polymer-forming cytoskeletal protein [Thermomicrobiales bacterium]